MNYGIHILANNQWANRLPSIKNVFKNNIDIVNLEKPIGLYSLPMDESYLAIQTLPTIES